MRSTPSSRSASSASRLLNNFSSRCLRCSYARRVSCGAETPQNAKEGTTERVCVLRCGRTRRLHWGTHHLAAGAHAAGDNESGGATRRGARPQQDRGVAAQLLCKLRACNTSCGGAHCAEVVRERC